MQLILITINAIISVVLWLAATNRLVKGRGTETAIILYCNSILFLLWAIITMLVSRI